MANAEILVVEDDRSLEPVLGKIAEDLGFRCRFSVNGTEGLALALASSYAIVLLDLELPGMGGVEICRRIRAVNQAVPIIMITGRNDELSKVLGLELGADDYVSKPFSIPELTARLKALLRRISDYSRPDQDSLPVVKAGALVIDNNRRQVFKNDRPVEMSRTEFDLLSYLASRPGVPVRREDISQALWGEPGSTGDATITTYLSRIRQKIEDDPDSPRYLTTLRGVGYRFNSGES